MEDSETKTSDNFWTKINRSGFWWLVLFGILNVVVHSFFNNQYGYHRDELATIDDARFLAWGYVAYPPVTPFFARLAADIFGSSLIGLRFFAVLALSVAIILTGLMARDLGGGRFAQILAATCVLVAPIVILQGAVFQYVSFDYLWWVAIAFCFIKLLKTDDARWWWLGVGAFIGLGLLTKYTIALLVIGLVTGFLMTKARHFLKSPWLWAGAALSIIIWLPNIIWQIQNHFISIEFLKSIHERDVRIGRTGDFLSDQFLICINILTVPVVLAGLWFYVKSPSGEKFRAVFWLFAVPLVLFVAMRGRAYYFAPAYPMIFAAGAVLGERWIDKARTNVARLSLRASTLVLLSASGALLSLVLLPAAQINSPLWAQANQFHDLFREELGWDDLADTVANIYQNLPAEEKPHTAIFAGNYGEAGAINRFGRARNLPEAISLVNSYWQRGYGDPPPETVILVGFKEEDARKLFEHCDFAAENKNRFSVGNEESLDHPQIFVCQKMRLAWEDFWRKYRSFG